MGLRKKKSLLEQATDTVTQYADQVKPQVESAVAVAKEKAGPALADARARTAPVIADAKAKAAPVLADAKAKAGPAVASGAAIAAERIATGASIAAEKAAEAAQAAADKVEEVTTAPEKKKKGSKLKKLLVLSGIVAAAAFVAKKLKGSPESENWQSSYTPTPAPRPVTEDDVAGASPGEAIADQAEAPHPVTTPDEPAAVVDVDVDEKK